MTRTPLVSLSFIVVAAMTLGACTSRTSPPTKYPTAVAASSPTGSSVSTDTVHLTDYARTDGPTSTVILSGAIGDYGTGTTVHPDGSVDPDHAGELKLALVQGTFRINIADLHTEFADAFTRQFPTNAATCSGSVTVSAAAPVVAGSGTGAYAHLSGSFNLSLTLDEVDQKPTCDGTGAFLAQTMLITGSGTVSLT